MGTFEWDRANLDHIARHGLTRGEVEEAFHDRYAITAEAYDVHSERRLALVGSILGGRILYVAYTYRGPRTRVVNARLAHRRELRAYFGR